MEMRRGFSWGSTAAMAVGVLALVLIFLVWKSTSKTDTENYQKGATHNETTIAPNEYQLVRCGQLFAWTPEKKK